VGVGPAKSCRCNQRNEPRICTDEIYIGCCSARCVWLGYLGCTAHEHTQATGTVGGAAADFAEKNLEGCYAKRQLEAAKFIWMEGMEALVKGIAVLAVEMKAETEVGSDGTMLVEMDNEKLARSELLFVRAEHLFERASKKKSGWGWGVNNGEIYLGLASSILLQSRIERRSSACKLVEMAADRNARLPWTLYLQTFCRSKMDHDEAEMEKLREFVTSTMQRTLVMVQPKPREDQLPLLPHQR
jgi:hypothetical protein